MKYQIVIDNKLSSVKAEDYDNLESAQKKIEKSYKKNRTRIIEIPDNFDVGMKLYNKGKIYGTIVRLFDGYIYVNRAFKDKDDEVAFWGADFIDKFINGTFSLKGEN